MASRKHKDCLQNSESRDDIKSPGFVYDDGSYIIETDIGGVPMLYVMIGTYEAYFRDLLSAETTLWEFWSREHYTN